MFRQSRVSSRVVAGVAVAAVAGTVGVVLATGAGSSGSEEEPSGKYSAEDVAGWLPTVDGYYFYEPTVLTAGDAWLQGWPDQATTPFDPPECLEYVAAVEVVLATDESETADDGLAFLFGALESDSANPGSFTGAYVKTRTFPSSSAAQDYVDDLKAKAGLCADGYGYTLPEGLEWSVDSVTASTTTLGGAAVLVVDEQGLHLETTDDYDETYPHYTHYAYIQDNVIIVASYVVTTETAPDQDATALIGQFIAYLDQL
jgi:hypothetical protein